MKQQLWKRGAALFLTLVMAVTVVPDKAVLAKASAVKTEAEQTMEDEDSVSGKLDAQAESGGNKDSSDKSVLKALNLDVPADSSYRQDALYTGTQSVGSAMSELIVTEGGTTNYTNIYDYDLTNDNSIRETMLDGAFIGVQKNQYNYRVTETLDMDGDGKKESLADLYLENGKRGGKIKMTLVSLKKTGKRIDVKEVFKDKETGGEIVTNANISSWEIEGLLSMCAGDFDGDGCEELAVYTPNNKAETSSGSTPDTLQIKIFKLGKNSSGLGEPWQVIDIAKVGSKPEDCQEWLYSHAGKGGKQYYCIPYMQLTAGDISHDGIDDLLTVASFSSTFRGRELSRSMTWSQILNPNNNFASVLDVYQGKRAGALEQVVKKRVLVAQDPSKDKDNACVLRNASVTIANVTGANTNEIVFGGNLTGMTYSKSTGENTTVTANCCVWTDDSDDPKVVVGYVSAKSLLADNSSAAALSYNWTIHDNGYNPLHYYNGDAGKGKYSTGDYGAGNAKYDAACEPVNLDGFAAYGYGQPDTIALEGQLFELSEDSGRLACNAYQPPTSMEKSLSNVWLSSQVVGNVTNDSFGQETLYFTNCQKKSGKEEYWNDIVSVWGVVDANGKKSYTGKSIDIANGNSASAMHHSLAMCDIDEDSTYIQYEAGNTDVYYSDVQVLSVLQAAPVYDDLGEDYVGGAETSYGKSTGSSTGEGQSVQISAGVIVGFEHETSFLGLAKAFSVELETELSASVGWESEKTAEKSLSTSYQTGGLEDAAVIYTVPYVRYNAKIFVPAYQMPVEAEFDAKKAFSEELKAHLIKYKDIKAGVTGGTYANPKDSYNRGYTTNVTADNYEYQLKTYYKYMEWIEQTQTQIHSERDGFTGTHAWGEKIAGGWEDYFYSIPQTPIITSVSVDTYERIAKDCSNLQSLYGTALPSGYRAGDPATYADSATLLQKTTAVPASIENGKMTFGSEQEGTKGDGFVNVTPLSSAGTSVTQSVEFNEENAKTQTVGAGISIEATAGVGDFKAGLSFSTEYESSRSTSTTKGCAFEGTVPNLPQRPAHMGENAYEKYSYNWKLVAYEAMVNGSRVPVVGYYTKIKNTEAPPSTAVNLELEDVKSDSVSLMWSKGKRPADHYNIYQVSGSKDAKKYDKVGTVTAAGSGVGIYHFTHDNLQPEQTYTYVVGAYNADETLASVYSDELEAVTPVPEFDVGIKLEGINSSETYLAGNDKTLKASLVTENYKDNSEVDNYIWQVNDGSGWKKLPNESGLDTYTWKALAGQDGYQYRCGAYVAVKNQVYRLYSEPVVLHVRKAEAAITIKADKSEGAADTSSEFGLAAYTNGDVLSLTAQVETEEGSQPEGNLVFVVTDNANAANVRKYPAAVSEDGCAEAKCTFARVGKYTITADYEENERVNTAVSKNSLPYYAYDISQREDRIQGQEMEQAIYDKAWDDVTIKNAIEKKEEITELSTEYEGFEQKDFVEAEAKKKLENTVDILTAAETLEGITSAADVTVENAIGKKQEIEEARANYEKLKDTQKALLKEEQAEEKLKTAENTLKASETAAVVKKLADITVDSAAARKKDVTDARAAYNKLTDEQKKLVPEADKKALAGAEDKLKAAEAVAKIKALGTVTAENAAKKKNTIDDAEKAYNALTKEQKALVPDAVKKALTDAKTAYQKASEPDGTEKLTDAEKAAVKNIADKLGISTKTAVSVWKLADEMDIDTDTLLLREEDILAETSEKDLKGSKFGKLRVKAAKVTANSVKLSWTKLKGADGYFVYGAACGKKNAYKQLAEIKKGSAKSYTLKKLKKGTCSRFIVRAYKVIDGEKITVSASKAVHIATEGGKKGNPKGIKADKSKAAMKKGKTLTLKASEIKGKKPSKKCRKLCYESSNEKIAAVAKNGKVTAKAKGKCTIYIYTQNGLYKQVKITVK